MVKVEVERAVKWLQADRSELHFSALVILDALAKETPEAFYECILTIDFVELLVPTLRSSKVCVVIVVIVVVRKRHQAHLYHPSILATLSNDFNP